MPPPLPRRAPAAPGLPLIGHTAADAIAAWRKGEPVGAGRFLEDVERTVHALGAAGGHVLNACADRYRFAVVLCAAIVRGQVTLLPPTTTPNVIASLRRFAPDACFVSDDPAATLGLPRVALPPLCERASRRDLRIPEIPADRLVACVFTSGSTGEPKPNFKTWGGLVEDVRAEAARLDVGPGHTVLGTVPPQHMYGFESTVLLPLLTGARLTAERLYYPADIDEAIRRAPPPRLLFTTPFHLRAWIEGGDAAALERIVSATAPLSVALAREAEAATGAEVHEIYGCTESGQVATRRPTRTAEWHAYGGLRVRNDGSQAMVGGGWLAQDTPLQDLIEVLGDGTRFLLHGRTHDLVNIAGKRNSLGYLDHQLAAIPGVKDAAFFLPDEEHPDGVTRLMAFVVAPALDAPSILAALRERIDPAFMPRPLVLLERLPREATGKLPREALRSLARAHRPPRNG